MKKLHKLKAALLFIYLALPACLVWAQEEAPEKPELVVGIRYFVSDNLVQYVQIQTRVKANNKLELVKDVALQVYLDSIADTHLVAKLKTNEKGEATTIIPSTLKDQWNSGTTHKFIAVTEAKKELESVTTELDVSRAKILMDTLNEEGARWVSAQVLMLQDGEWLPAADVELKLGVRRLGGILRIGEEETYTTDSTGMVTGEFILDSIPADDKKGMIVLVAKTEDNELFGNLTVEKQVPWGAYIPFKSNMKERSLWATGDKAPVWLLLMACSIVAGVWGVIIYLGVQIIKIKRMGKERKGAAGEALVQKEAERLVEY